MLDSGEREKGLTEEEVQRVLARAVELDARTSQGTSVSRIREISRELGIPDVTLDRALAELRSAPPASVEREPRAEPSSRWRQWWRRVMGASIRRTLTDEVLVNAGVFAVFFGALGFAARLSRLLGGAWQVHAGLFVLVNVAAVVLARRSRARPATLVLATTAVAQAVEYAFHLAYGIRAVQGGPTHFAVIAAAAAAFLVAPFLRSGRGGEAAPRPIGDPEIAPAPSSERAEGGGEPMRRVSHRLRFGFGVVRRAVGAT